MRGKLRNFGLKVGMVGKMKFEARVEELVESPRLGRVGGTTAYCPAGTTQQIVVLHRCLLAIVRDDEVCQRLMTNPRCWPCGGGR